MKRFAEFIIKLVVTPIALVFVIINNIYKFLSPLVGKAVRIIIVWSIVAVFVLYIYFTFF